MVNHSGIANQNSWLEICDNVAFVLQNKGTSDIYVIASATTPTSVGDAITLTSGEIITDKDIVGKIWVSTPATAAPIAWAVGEALSSGTISDTISVLNAVSAAETALEVATQWGGFAGVDTAGGDFVTNIAGVNGQLINVLSANPLTTGESSVVNYNKAVQQPCSMEFACSFVRGGGIGFATASLFANDPINGADPVPAPINIVSYYQSSATQGAANTTTAGTTLTINLETALPAVGANNAVFIGDWANITGLVDTRFNYPNACINFISADRKLITIGFSDEVALPSLVSPASGVTTPTLGTAKVNFYNNFSGARNAFGLRFTGTTSTSAAIVSIFGGDDNQVSGALLGDHRINVAAPAT